MLAELRAIQWVCFSLVLSSACQSTFARNSQTGHIPTIKPFLTFLNRSVSDSVNSHLPSVAFVSVRVGLADSATGIQVASGRDKTVVSQSEGWSPRNAKSQSCFLLR